MSTITPTHFSISRTAHLTRWNTVLLGRNRLALMYAVVLPISPILMLLAVDRGDESIGATSISAVVLLAALFPVFYNVLSQFVSRRDELVLKRMRTGEARDLELLVGIAMPGILSAAAISGITVPLAAALGQPLPLNVVLYAGTVLLVVVTFTAFAYWTAAWTRSAEAAQLTSLPVLLLAMAGPAVGGLPGLSDMVRDIVALTPGAAMGELVRIAWYGLDGLQSTNATLTFSETWNAAVSPAIVLAAWTVVAIDLARRSLRWEPRT